MRILKRVALCAGAVLAFCSYAQAQTCPGLVGATRNYASETITVSSTAIGITAGLLADGVNIPLFAEVRYETNSIRIRLDGLSPTATVGDLWETATNARFTICGQTSLRQFRAIRASADAPMFVKLYSY